MQSSAPDVLFPMRHITPRRSLARRVGVAVGIVLAIALITWFDRGSYSDADGNGVNFLDAIYYSTVTVTTTGYGDIAPLSPGARAWTAFVVTPLRAVFLIVLVGTTLQLLTERYRKALAENRWRRRVTDHTIVAGYGTKGRGAVDTLLASGTPHEGIVVIDIALHAVEEARARGLTSVLGDATRTAVLSEAMVERATSVVVTCNRDDTATLVTLTARELNPAASIVVAVKEQENAHLLRYSGAGTVVISSESAGRLLGLATRRPRTVAVISDLIVAGEGLEMVERHATADEVGGPPRVEPGQLHLAVVRGDERIAFDDPRCQHLLAGDVIVSLRREEDSLPS